MTDAPIILDAFVRTFSSNLGLLHEFSSVMLISIYGIPSPLSFVAQRKAIPLRDLDLLVIFRLGSVHFFFACWFPFFPVTN